MSIDQSMRFSIISTIQNGLPEIRKELGLSQTALANLLGKTRQMISLIERNESELTWETCLAIVAIVLCRDHTLIVRMYGNAFKKDLQKVLTK